MIDLLRLLTGELDLLNRGRELERERIAGLAKTWGHMTFANYLQQCRYPHCEGGDWGVVCSNTCTNSTTTPKVCSDCKGLGYDYSGMVCGCQFRD